MKESNLSFADGFLGVQSKAAAGSPQKKFDWDKAALIIKEKLIQNPDLVAEAGLPGDWKYTGGVIFEEGKPTNDSYTYLSSNRATPILTIQDDKGNDDEIECYTDDVNSRFNEKSKWDEVSLGILGVEI